MQKTQLTPHFSLEEMTRSATALRLNIDNRPAAAHVANLCRLCINVLEPLRHRFGPLVVTSGYRSPQLNRAVGGVATSQHTRGEAADVRVESPAQGREMLAFVSRCCNFDQAILEYAPRTNRYWLHVSCKACPENNRRQAWNACPEERRNSR
ncbi:MAG: D-Ala-D-Ala carboxypeptidase family metallohydrolase [Prevotellaceae bacterium]|nr:D-Ala-D-Ala carboxypeptidase family metallohydrolase [Prevotella sp.]MDD7529902.1 D-Ala-D-Ala carboxypeptidase family metallohydrolase [Prevotellaceae bacterium]MDY2634002.1 D-Ala-D-Ala carboxypeptidase family metallohydrolase [Prevotella sp.]